jgi:hypothetical protein
MRVCGMGIECILCRVLHFVLSISQRFQNA